MSKEQWAAVDRYIGELLWPADAALESALQASEAAGLPRISVTPNQGKLLQLLAQMQGAKQILEIGTLGGFSTIFLARGLAEGGRLISLEVEPKHAEVALKNIARAGLAAVVKIKLGKALETLPKLAAEGAGPFDLIFIDADKENIPEYFHWALLFSRVGSVIVVDNVVRNGAVSDAASTDVNVRGVRQFNEMLAAEKRVSATVIQTVGSKGYDGFALVRVNEGAT